MIATARDAGDQRTDPEVVAALMLGADLTAERHADDDMRLRGASAFEACRAGWSTAWARTGRPT
jgi:hypothetical protein